MLAIENVRVNDWNTIKQNTKSMKTKKIILAFPIKSRRVQIVKQEMKL